MSNKSNNKKASKETSTVIPAISLDRPEPKKLSTGQYLTLKCQNTPGDAESTTYNLNIPYFGSGTAEEWLQFVDNLNKGITGQNITDGPGRYGLAEKLLIGEMLTAFRSQTTARGNQTVANFKLVLKDLASYVFKSTDYRDQKIYMRRYMTKPRDLAIRPYVARVRELNNFLKQFPTGNVNTAPTSLGEDEIKDLLYHGIPKSWQHSMVKQGFSYQDETVQKFISFCERLEAVEKKPTSIKKSGSSSKKNNKHK